MKIYVKCESPLLKKSLEIFLKDKISPYANCDFVVSDKKLEVEKPVFIVGDDKYIKKPFSKSKLLKALEAFYNRPKQERLKSAPREPLSLEKKVSIITEKFVRELLRVIREHNK